MKLTISKEPFSKYGGKTWIRVKFGNDADWIPSFKDLFEIVQAICECEDEKYPNRRGRAMVAQFVWEACRPDQDWEKLRDQFKIPNRNSEK